VPDYDLLEPAPLTFVVLPALLVCLLAWGTRAAWERSGATPAAARRASALSVIAACTWMGATWVAAASGILRQWERTPPPFGLLVAAIIGLACAMTYGRFGTRVVTTIPLSVLVLVQSFRLPLELAMHGMYTRGIMPGYMTYTGLNFDIITGATAIPVAVLTATGLAGRGIVALWNVIGFAL
jgi:hypothetical protein